MGTFDPLLVQEQNGFVCKDVEEGSSQNARTFNDLICCHNQPHFMSQTKTKYKTLLYGCKHTYSIFISHKENKYISG